MATYTPDSFGGITDAINQLRVSNGYLRKEYPASFEGIRDALLDMKREWGNSGTGQYPPGWEITTDDDGNPISGNWNPQPSEGQLWFDERQGRLMIWVNDGFYQTNGADTLTAVSDSPPTYEVEGALWYQPSTTSLYLWDGLSWQLITSSTFSTSTLQLANGSGSYAANNREFLPDSSNPSTQQDLNEWFYASLIALEGNIGTGNTTVTVSTTAPTDAEVGDLWFNSGTNELYIYLNSNWVATSIPPTVQADITQIQTDLTQVETQQTATQQQLNNSVATLTASIQALQALPHHTYDLAISNSSRITLTDNNGSVILFRLTVLTALQHHLPAVN